MNYGGVKRGKKCMYGYLNLIAGLCFAHAENGTVPVSVLTELFQCHDWKEQTACVSVYLGPFLFFNSSRIVPWRSVQHCTVHIVEDRHIHSVDLILL